MAQIIAFVGLPKSGRTTILFMVSQALARKGRIVKIMPMNKRDLDQWRSDVRLFLFKNPDEGVVLLDDIETNIQAELVREMRGKVIEIDRGKPTVVNRELLNQTLYNTGTVDDLFLNIQYKVDTGVIR